MALEEFVKHTTELVRTKSLDGAGHLRRDAPAPEGT